MTYQIHQHGEQPFDIDGSKLVQVSLLQALGTNPGYTHFGVYYLDDHPAIAVKMFGSIDATMAERIEALAKSRLGRTFWDGHPLFAAPIGTVHENGKLVGYVMPRAPAWVWENRNDDKMSATSATCDLQRASLLLRCYLYLRNQKILHGDMSTANFHFDTRRDQQIEHGLICFIDFDDSFGRGLGTGSAGAKGLSLCPKACQHQTPELRETATALCTACVLVLGFVGKAIPWGAADDDLPWSTKRLEELDEKLRLAPARAVLRTWIEQTVKRLTSGDPMSLNDVKKGLEVLGTVLVELGVGVSPAERVLVGTEPVPLTIGLDQARAAAWRANQYLGSKWAHERKLAETVTRLKGELKITEEMVASLRQRDGENKNQLAAAEAARKTIETSLALINNKTTQLEGELKENRIRLGAAETAKMAVETNLAPIKKKFGRLRMLALALAVMIVSSLGFGIRRLGIKPDSGMERQDNAAGAKAACVKAQPFATEADLNLAGYALISDKKLNEAIAVFRDVVQSYPQSWNAQDSLGEALALKGDKAGAITAYKKALSMVRDPAKRQRIEQVLAGLEK